MALTVQNHLVVEADICELLPRNHRCMCVSFKDILVTVVSGPQKPILT
jgi:hypothetical protein